jgi:hypothetical protein
MKMTEMRGTGTLFRPDRTPWGMVEYSIVYEEFPPGGLGSLRGKLNPVQQTGDSGDFWEFFDGTIEYGALHLEDGRWILLVIDSDGSVTPRSGNFHPDGRQPTV